MRTAGFLIDAVSCRIPRPVTKIVQYPTYGYCYPLCPRCQRSLEREYMNFCDRCGQKLSWNGLDHAVTVAAPLSNQDRHRSPGPVPGEQSGIF